MPQQTIFGDRNYKQKLANFSLDTIADLPLKKKTIEKYIRTLESGKIERTKETPIQTDFLNKFFGDILEYHFNDPDLWNLEKEHKLVTNGSKADGVLGFFSMVEKIKTGDVRAVIVLKDASTDLDKGQNRLGDKRTPVEQAFSYSAKVGGRCKWVIVSNFKEIRLYHATDQSRYENFLVADLANPEFLKRFFFLLHKDRLLSRKGESILDTIYRERLEFEQTISKQFYNQYKTMRLELFEHLKQHNPNINHLVLITKTQKLLDRFIFACFCEDVNLLPAYTLKKIKDILKNAFDLEPDKVWRQLKGLFHSIDMGNPPIGITRFNGGLFKKDDLLDSLTIRDSILLKLIDFSDFDFASDLNVNILGHIFEQSLADIEEIKARIGNGDSLSLEEKADIHKNGKRKKDGIFYTPEYITHSIVKEAIGGWLEDCKQGLGFYNLPELTAEDFKSIKLVRRKSKTDGKMVERLENNENITQHVVFWEAYKEQLRNIKILDPACGSGAFLNQAFDYLYSEGRKVNDEIRRLRLDQREIVELDRHILTQNLYGVDLNPESVEITKLSLWLKTASVNKGLTALEDNIKCGNSLIDDPAIAGAHAFAWTANFPEIFRDGLKPVTPSGKPDAEGVFEPHSTCIEPNDEGVGKYGFDVIIGNPPWIFARDGKFDQKTKEFYYQNYKLAHFQLNTYALFIEKAFNLLKHGGYFGFIIPNTWLTIDSFQGLRKFILENTGDIKIVNIYGKIFEQADVDCCLLIFKKTRNNAITLGEIRKGSIDHIDFIGKFQTEQLNTGRSIINISFLKNSILLKIMEKIEDIAGRLKDMARVSTGVKVYQRGKGNPSQTDEIKKNRVFHTKELKNETYKKYLEGRDVGRYGLNWSGEYVSYGDWIAEPRKSIDFAAQRILVRQIPAAAPYCIHAVFTAQEYINDINSMVVFDFKQSPLFILACLNSTLISFWFINTFDKLQRGLFPQFKVNELADFPICLVSPNLQQPLQEKAELMLHLNQELQEFSLKFIQLLQSQWSNLKITGKISGWYNLSFEDFRTELEKQKIKLLLPQQAHWLSYFTEQKEQAQRICTEIAKTDEKINKQVFELYGLTEEEIQVVEGR